MKFKSIYEAVEHVIKTTPSITRKEGDMNYINYQEAIKIARQIMKKS